MSGADALIFTSLQEGTPHVVHEALSLGLPVLCHDSCGHAESIDETCGIKVAVRNPAASVAGFAEAVTTLLRAPQRVEELSRGALARVQQLTWDKKARQMVSIYYAALGKQEQAQSSVESDL
jgi:glycosyltransferase involved in cell wall biosynthesis